MGILNAVTARYVKRIVILAPLACVLLGIAAWSLKSLYTAGAPAFVHPLSPLESVPAISTSEGARSIEASSTPPCDVGCDSGKLLREMERALIVVDELERDRAYTQLLPALIALDPPAVARLVENSAPGRVREELLHHTARLWTATDLDGAIDWAATLKDDNERTTAAVDIASRLAQSDPAGAIEVSDLFDIGRDNGAVEHLAQLWATDNLSEALEWVQQQPASGQRDQLLARVIAVQAAADPANAAEAALSQITAGPKQQETVIFVVRQWATQHPDAASEWVENLSNATLRERARNELTQLAQQRAFTAIDPP